MKKILVSENNIAKLNPCALCGRKPEMLCRIRIKSVRTAFICSQCGRSTGYCLTEELAVDAWNKINESM